MLPRSFSTTLAFALFFTGSAHAEQPWRLQTALNAPEWLTVEGEARVRYETLDKQFRAGGSGGDQILAFRTLLLLEADPGPVAFGLEFQDSRASFDDSGTPLSTSIVNPLDVLQAYVRVDLDGVFGTKEAALKLGRQTLSIGSQRVFERVDMANVIFSYSGAYWRSTTARGDELHLLAFSPTGRMPTDRASLADDTLSGDEEQWGRVGWGAHYRAANALGDLLPGVWLEGYLYGLRERDTASVATPNRDYLQPGFRVFRAPKAGEIDFDVEGAWRTGSRRATAAAADVRDLDVDAQMLYAHVGYTWDHQIGRAHV